jgi:drug/metabolite transporter (DMT)-like permease
MRNLALIPILLLFTKPIFMASNLILARGGVEFVQPITGFTLYIFTIYAAIYGFIFFYEKLESYHFAETALFFFGVYLAKKNYETKT